MLLVDYQDELLRYLCHAQNIILHISTLNDLYQLINQIHFSEGLWWLVDWIRVLDDTFYDGNGNPLMNDM